MTDLKEATQTLAGKIALVTGSSRGIGKSIALELARRGADVGSTSRGEAAAAEAVANEIERRGVRALVVQANIADPADVQALFASASEKLGGVDLLVCNAASGSFGAVGDLPPKAMNMAFGVNALGALLCAQAALPLMRSRGGGRIVLITSPGAQRVVPGYAAVGASKGALDSLARYLAVELAPYNVAVNAVSPGICETEALHVYFTESHLKALVERTPMGRIVTPEEIASLVCFLCQDDASMICGQTIAIDGGLLLSI